MFAVALILLVQYSTVLQPVFGKESTLHSANRFQPRDLSDFSHHLVLNGISPALNYDAPAELGSEFVSGPAYAHSRRRDDFNPSISISPVDVELQYSGQPRSLCSFIHLSKSMIAAGTIRTGTVVAYKKHTIRFLSMSVDAR
jgi:hypothetical protein